MKDFKKAQALLEELASNVDPVTEERLRHAFKQATEKQMMVKAFVNGFPVVDESHVLALDDQGWYPLIDPTAKRQPTPELAARAALVKALK